MTTPEEAAAQAALDEAVETFLRAEGLSGVLTQYVLVTHTVLPPSDDGDDRSAYTFGYRGGSMPDHEALGFLDYARIALERNIWRSANAEEDG